MTTSTQEDEAVAALKQLLAQPDLLEGSYQRLMEQYSELVPTTDMLNHDVQWNSIVSKLILPCGKEVDLAYITKSTAVWRIVLIELERPTKRLFVESPYPDFHNHTQDTIAQINVWKADAETKIQEIRDRLYSLMHVGGSFDTNPIEVRYVLIIGRNESGEFSKAESRLVYQLQTERKISLFTWDSLIRLAQQESRWRLNVLVQKDGRASFKRAQAHTNLFAAFTHKQITLPEDQEKWFRENGYDIDSWRSGKLLVLNDKHPSSAVDKVVTQAVSNIIKKV